MRPCPFCGRAINADDIDTLYPSGTGWKEDEDGETYNQVILKHFGVEE